MDSFWNASSKKTNVNSMRDYLNQSIHDAMYLNKRVLLLEVLNKKVIEKVKKDKLTYTSNLISKISKPAVSPASYIVTSAEVAKFLNDTVDGPNDNQGEENENI
mgnify:CR=1 FL=1|tara:strand:+ start:1875 stop:2186 length:312 start_codon:yes stop_codon:yes gene_type:complete